MYHNGSYEGMFKPEEVIDYLRKSQSDDPLLTVEEVLAKHEKILDEWAEKHLGGKVPEQNKFREVVSGETIKERPEINKVLRLIESPKYKAVKIVEPQRLTRGDLEDIGRLMKLFKHTNTYVITPERIYDLRDEYDWNAFEAELKRGNDYLKYYKKIQNRGKLLSVSQGNYIGSVAPYGYDKITIVEDKRKCPTLIENPEQANVVRMIYDLYVNKNYGRIKICHYLDDLGIKPPKGEHWASNSVKEILRNVHYIGKVRWNWRKTIEIVEQGEILKVRPQSQIGEYLICEGKHMGIVSQDLFDAAQEKKGRNARTTSKAKIRNPFASILFCKNCGKAVILSRFTQTGKKPKCAPRIMCSHQSRCDTGSCLFSEMIEQVSAILRECIADFEIRLQNDEGDSLKLHNNLIKRLEKRAEELKEKELAQWEAQAHPDPSKRMPHEIFTQLNERLLKEKEEVQQALCKAYDSMPDPINYEEKIVLFSDALRELNNPDADPELQNNLLKACIDRIEYSKERPTRAQNQGDKGWNNPPIHLDVKLRV